jgi:hypothetical protein
MFGADFAEGVPFQITLYGSTRTYMVSKNGGFATSGVALGGLLATAMRYD